MQLCKMSTVGPTIWFSITSVVAFTLYVSSLSIHLQHYDDSMSLLTDGLFELIERSRTEE